MKPDLCPIVCIEKPVGCRIDRSCSKWAEPPCAPHCRMPHALFGVFLRPCSFHSHVISVVLLRGCELWSDPCFSVCCHCCDAAASLSLLGRIQRSHFDQREHCPWRGGSQSYRGWELGMSQLSPRWDVLCPGGVGRHCPITPLTSHLWQNQPVLPCFDSDLDSWEPLNPSSSASAGGDDPPGMVMVPSTAAFAVK